MKKVLGLLLVLVLSFVSGTEYYVDKDSVGGICNNNYSLSQNDLSHPWCTISKGYNSLSEGDALIIRQGVYHARIYLLKSNILIKGFDGELPVIDGEFTSPSGEYASSSALIQCGDKTLNLRNITIENLEIKRSAGAAILIRNYEGVVVRNIIAHDIREHGIICNGCKNFLIENSTTYNTNENHIGGTNRPWGCAIVSISSENVIMRNLVVFNGSGEGVSIIGVKNATIENCTIYNTYSALLYSNWGQDVVIRNNLVYATREPKFYRNNHGAPSSCIAAAAEPASQTGGIEGYRAKGYGNNIAIYNNVVAGSLFGIYVEGGNLTAKNFSIYNNIMADSISSDNIHSPLVIGGKIDGIVVKNNIIVQQWGSILKLNPHWPVNFSNNFWSKTPDVDVGTNNLFGDPSFAKNMNWTNLKPGKVTVSDFMLSENSRAIDAGIDVGIDYDYFGNARDSNPDIGAFEYDGIQTPISENCNNSIDDDSDGLIDCLDSSCPACVPIVDVVDVSDIFAKIAEWKAGQISLDDVFVVIRAWGEGGWL